MLKKTFNPVLIFMVAALLMQGCIKDHCTQTYSYFVPVYKTTEEVRANIKSNAPREMERTGKLYIRGNYIFLNEIDKGIHIIDNAIPTAPKNVAFIDIPGNMDMAVKGNTLYADAYTDLVTLDITDPLNAKTTKIVENAFPFRQYYGTFYPDNSKVIVDWVKRDTTVNIDCGNGGFFGIDLNKSEAFMYNDVRSLAGYSDQSMFNSSSSKSVSPFGTGGSMARFAVAGYYLYSVTLNDLNVFEISRPQQPSFTNKINIGENIETIFPFQQKLFIGSATGMYIYSISNGGNPVKESRFLHVQSCDPVIADEKHAYVTLRTGTTCNSVSNRLEILDIADINSPSLVKTYEMTNPHGLSKDGDILFICDGANGLKVYNAADVRNLKPITAIEGIETYDVIAMNNIALVVTSDGLYQYLYADPGNIQLLSKIKVKQQ
ncbi:hypothetical protein [Agriterribacter sp.]|uniref:LVIVD repeat-containing protein n=1 Tax=Agriterribacter sp. TaxID=2821509 RepID=UPI002C41CCA5|nr:hypothetical protein [Agriterribacter sp.]HRP58423.1 hypothetical protein [Agriterribacter sp.]